MIRSRAGAGASVAALALAIAGRSAVGGAGRAASVAGAALALAIAGRSAVGGAGRAASVAGAALALAIAGRSAVGGAGRAASVAGAALALAIVGRSAVGGAGRAASVAGAALALAIAGGATGAPAAEAAAPVAADDFRPFLDRVQSALIAADLEAYLALLADGADSGAARRFARVTFRPGIDAATAQLRFLRPLDEVAEGTGYELTVEVFTERGIEGRLQTWRLDVVRADPLDGQPPPPWRIAGQERIDVLEGLVHLSLNPGVAFDAANLVVAGEDMTLRMSRGSVFVAESRPGHIAGMVLLGDGVLTFSPEPEAERGQVRLLAGSGTLEAEVSAAFVRVNPRAFASRVSGTTLVGRRVEAGDLDRAREVFDEFLPLSFAVDLGDLSDKAWSLNPRGRDFVAEMRTKRYGALTFLQSGSQPEDVTLFEREAQRIIALYPSARKRAVQGRYYSDDDTQPYDVLDYRIAASFEPAGITRDSLFARPRLRGCVITATARLAVRVTTSNLTSMTLRLDGALDVRSVASRNLGPLLFFRMPGRDTLVISMPGDAPPIGAEFTVEVEYSGLLRAQDLAENWLGREHVAFDGDSTFGSAEPRYIYSNSSFWYPQASVSDYATATLDLTVPGDYGVVASGEPHAGNPPAGSELDIDEPRRYRFVTLQPARYLACVISRFAVAEMGGREVSLEPPAPPAPPAARRRGVSYDSLFLTVESNRRTTDRVAGFYDEAARILRFYASLIGDTPYPTFTLLLTDAFLPGGHSPAYFAVLNQTLPYGRGRLLSWRGDPVAFSKYPSFFLAHELAHQWWGQAVGWKNYHEQWLSEGLSQYFAALYAEHRNGPDVFDDVIAQMQRWSLRHSDQGPVYLGNRLGRIKEDPRVFRALVYNKGAMVLHMLRRTVGDHAFFNGLRRFYNDRRFAKAGTDDLIRAFESESGHSLTAFFDRWIHEADLPSVAFSYRTEVRRGGAAGAGRGGETDAVLRFEQRGKLFDMPVTVTLRYRGGDDDTLVVPVTGEVTEVRVPVRRGLRDVVVNRDRAALVEIG